MGFSPAQIDAMSVWEFDAVLDCWIDANTPEEEKNNRLTDEESEMLIADLMSFRG